jgi:hypothetical protein
LTVTVSPNPNLGSKPGGGNITFSFGVSISGGSGSYSISWDTGDTGYGTSVTVHVPANDEVDGFVNCSVTDLVTGASGSGSAEYIAHGF